MPAVVLIATQWLPDGCSLRGILHDTNEFGRELLRIASREKVFEVLRLADDREGAVRGEVVCTSRGLRLLWCKLLQ